MTVRNLLEDIRAEPFPEFHYPLLMAGGAKMATLAGKGNHKELHPFRPI